MKLNDRRKKSIIVISGIFVAILAVHSIPEMVSTKVDVPAQQPQPRNNPQHQSQISTMAHHASFLSSNGTGDFFTVNPFIDLNSLQVQKKDDESFRGNQGLPAIPAGGTVPPPNIGSIPIPQLPAGAMPPSNASTGGKVSGILFGSGGNMAIMSDGKVVSVGDTYADGRIAYIGGDGIQFDDGHKLEYK